MDSRFVQITVATILYILASATSFCMFPEGTPLIIVEPNSPKKIKNVRFTRPTVREWSSRISGFCSFVQSLLASTIARCKCASIRCSARCLDLKRILADSTFWSILFSARLWLLDSCKNFSTRVKIFSSYAPFLTLPVQICINLSICLVATCCILRMDHMMRNNLFI